MPPRQVGRPRLVRLSVARKPGPRIARYTNAKTKRMTGKGMKVAKSNNVLLHTPLLPLSKFSVTPYYDNATVSIASGTSSGYVITANGLYDPNITGVGHQPMGFDQLMLFYEHYTVTKAKITVNFWNTTDSNIVVGILIAPDAVLETNYSKLNENGMLVKKLLAPFQTGSGQGHICSVTVMANISKINGKKDVKSEDDFRGDITANPVEQTYFHIFGYNPNALVTSTFAFETLVEYTAIFTEPRKMVQS